jgi:hypothetical protein
MVKPKRILRRFSIAEVSVVDKPAQSGALALILKRHDKGQGIMDGIVDDTPSADEAILESFRSIVDENEDLDTEPRVAMLLESVQQYLVATGATLDNPRLGGPEELAAAIIAVAKLTDDLRKANPALSEIVARARIFEDPANRDLAKRYNEAMSEAVIEKSRGTAAERASNLQRQKEADKNPKSKTSPFRASKGEAHKALRDRADAMRKADSKLSLGRALDIISSSRDPSDKAIWMAARAE